MFGIKKYKLDLCGREEFYGHYRKSYRKGARVKIYYPDIGTDTDYSFFLDGERVQSLYSEKHGFVITFVMPGHDASLVCRSVCSMDPTGR